MANFWNRIAYWIGLVSVMKAGGSLDSAEEKEQDAMQEEEFCSTCGYRKDSEIHRKVCLGSES